MSAVKEAAPPPPAEGAPPKKSKKLLIIIIASVLVLLLVLGGGLVWLLKSPAAEGEAGHEAKQEVKKEEKKAPPAYLKMEAYTVNIRGELGDQYLRLELTADFDDLQHAEEAKAYMPKIRNETMLLLSGKLVAELNSKEGKEKLAKEIRDEMNMILGEPEKGEKVPLGPVKEILFTDFVIQ